MSLLKSKKSTKKPRAESPYIKPHTLISTNQIKIKFDFNKTNLSCFIDQKRINKLMNKKRSQSQKYRKPSQKKKINTTSKPSAKA